MEFGLRVPPCENPRRVADLAVAAEVAGFSHIWLPDSQLLWRDVWITAALAAVRTDRIIIGTGVTNLQTRDVTVTGSAAVSMGEVARDRFILGLGAGESSVHVMGQRAARVTELRDSVALLRNLLRGEFASPHGKSVRLISANAAELPVYIAAGGPRMLRLAGEAGDGVIMMADISPDALAGTLRCVAEGAAIAGKTLNDRAIVNGVFCYVGDDWQDQLIQARPHAARHAWRHRSRLRESGAGLLPRSPAPELYPDLTHAEDWDAAVRDTAWVPDDFLHDWCSRHAIVGTAEQVREKISQLARQGITHLYLRGFQSYELPARLCRQMGESVIPLLKSES